MVLSDNPKWQVVEKTDFGTDWQLVRYDTYAMARFDTENEAIKAARTYLTHVNCDNSLTKDEKRSGSEAFMMLKKEGDEDVQECFLGHLDGVDWYMDYRQNVSGKLPDGSKGIVHAKGERVSDGSYFELEGKTQVAVRPVPGT